MPRHAQTFLLKPHHHISTELVPINHKILVRVHLLKQEIDMRHKSVAVVFGCLSTGHHKGNKDKRPMGVSIWHRTSSLVTSIIIMHSHFCRSDCAQLSVLWIHTRSWNCTHTIPSTEVQMAIDRSGGRGHSRAAAQTQTQTHSNRRK